MSSKGRRRAEYLPLLIDLICAYYEEDFRVGIPKRGSVIYKLLRERLLSRDIDKSEDAIYWQCERNLSEINERFEIVEQTSSRQLAW
jgi:hypothetical protein